MSLGPLAGPAPPSQQLSQDWGAPLCLEPVSTIEEGKGMLTRLPTRMPTAPLASSWALGEASAPSSACILLVHYPPGSLR